MLAIVFSAVELQDTAKNKLEAIYNSYKRLMFSCAFSIVGNTPDAEDILQTAFIKIAKNLHCIKDVESRETRSFLMVVTKNTAYDFLRKASRLNEQPIDSVENVVYSDGILEKLISKSEYTKTVETVKAIPSPYKEVLYLHFVKDFSVKQTAKLLDRKNETVKIQLVRGKKLLVKRLSEVLYE